MVTWLLRIVYPCPGCLSKGTALFFSFLSASEQVELNHHKIYACSFHCSELWADVLTFCIWTYFFTPKYCSFMALCEIVIPVQCFSTAAFIGHEVRWNQSEQSHVILVALFGLSHSRHLCWQKPQPDCACRGPGLAAYFIIQVNCFTVIWWILHQLDVMDLVLKVLHFILICLHRTNI
jgi:hypothetical protein